MRYLLDTHTWLWMVTAPARLGTAREVIEDRTNDLVLSAVSSWEIAIKAGSGRLPLPVAVERFVPDRMQATGVIGLSIEHAHTVQVANLPVHHKDPFDRMLVAQAQVEDLAILTADPVFDAYECEVVRVGTPTP